MTAAALASIALSFFASGADPTAGLTDRQLSGQRLVVGFHGTSAPQPLLRRIHRGELSGVVLFDYNIRSREQVRQLTKQLQAARPDGAPPLIVSIDQEGGLVKRLHGAPTLSPPQMHSATTARRQGRATARNLKEVGVNVDFAPVLDVARPGSAIGRQGRSFGATPAKVARRGGAFARGLSEGGVSATGKHFPGLGSARTNQDLEPNVIRTPLDRLRRIDERPFKQQPLALVMLSSATYSALSNKPAIFSTTTTHELRGRLGFTGVTISDALDAPAMRRFGTKVRKARSDILLFAEPTTIKPPPDRDAVRRILALRGSASAP